MNYDYPVSNDDKDPQGLTGRVDPPVTSGPEEPPPTGPTPVIRVPPPGDPGNCNGVHCAETESCAVNYKDDMYFSCQWSINHVNGTISTQTFPGHCDPISNPPKWGADGSDSSCLIQPGILASPSYRCVCSKGNCPKETTLKVCEIDQLYKQATHLVDLLIKQSESVNIGDACNYTLEQQLPQVITDYELKVNLYRVVSVLGDATDRERSKLPLCNRRRMNACKGDKCECADGTAQRQLTAPSGKTYYSYYCYATSGSCSRDPAHVIPQFRKQESAIHNHYGSPEMASHKDPQTGCLYNLCRSVKGHKCA
ncbi:hypothetical protein Ocin01_10547 [Orchesella cincta]|uniref:Uncharacterized protein n=1 Tax=Orchesella cincta TaxID=48709 RepID=A0A1D2MT75_ORCCI|nr:hypothetical protein Ocin01_10547 [Orchesella cincta]